MTGGLQKSSSLVMVDQPIKSEARKTSYRFYRLVLTYRLATGKADSSTRLEQDPLRLFQISLTPVT